jgi:hypothetical protein
MPVSAIGHSRSEDGSVATPWLSALLAERTAHESTNLAAAMGS